MFTHIHIPALEAQVERLCRPWLSRVPMVVQSEVADAPKLWRRGAGTVISAWPQVANIHCGLSVWEARLRCPDAVFCLADRQKYLFFWEKVCEVAAQHSPGLHEEPRHRISLDMAGTEMLFGPANKAAERMVHQIAQFGLTARAGIGHSRIMARLAADKANGGIGQLTAQDLGALPIDVLPDLDQRVREALHDLGLSTFAHVQAVPAQMFKAAFGEAGERLSCAARGADFTMVATSAKMDHSLRSPPAGGRSRLSTPDQSILEENRRLTPAVDDVAALRGVLMYLAELLGRRLRKSDLAAKEVRLRIGFRTSREQSFNIAALQDPDGQGPRGAVTSSEVRAAKLLENATTSDDALFRAALPALMRVCRPNGRPIRLLALGALRVCREQAAGQLYFPRFAYSRSLPLGLRPRGRRQAAPALDHTLDRIKDRYGEAALRRASGIITRP